MRESLWLFIGLLLAYVAFQLHRVWSEGRHGGSEVDVDDDSALQETVATSSEPFQATLELTGLRRDVDTLRAALAHEQQRGEALEDAVRMLRAEVEAARMAQGSSPEYSEALVCARRGLDAAAIAERCGMSLAEAELVRSLVAQQRNDMEDQG